MRCVIQMIVALHCFEMGENIRIPPAFYTVGGHPPIIVGGLAAHIDHCVDTGTTPQYSCLRNDNLTIIDLPLRLHFMQREISVPAQIFHVPRGHTHDRTCYPAARLEQQDSRTQLPYQTCCSDATGRPTPDNNIIVVHLFSTLY